MTEYIRAQKLLPAPLIDALIAATPTQVLTKEDFEKLGIGGWQDWIRRIIATAEANSLAA